MVRDNSPKIRNRRSLERRLNKRAPHDRILIVSEGSKTEPNYFNEIRSTYRLPTASICVRASQYGTSPLQVVEYARDLFNNGDEHKKLRAQSFELVYVVFDRDSHLNYDDALRLASSLDGRLKNDNKASVVFKAIPSIPCFELWLLLHFENVSAPIERREVVSRLKRYLSGYEKNMEGIFTNTRVHLDIAISRAKKLSVSFSATTAPNPYTRIHELVSNLINLKK